MTTVADTMLDEARTLVARAEAEGVTLRLVGGLAVRAVSRDRRFADRPTRDVDLVGRRGQIRQIAGLLERSGFTENPHFRFGSGGQVMQFFRPCVHAENGRRAHADDRVDVYLDAVRLEHSLQLRERLTLVSPTVPPTDILLVKLLRTYPHADDVRDAIALLKDLTPGDDDGPGILNVPYVARLCARDWPLHHDVVGNLTGSREAAGRLGLPDTDTQRVDETAGTVLAAITAAPKSWRWRLRAIPGERLPWSDAVEERDGRHLTPREYMR